MAVVLKTSVFKRYPVRSSQGPKSSQTAAERDSAAILRGSPAIGPR